MQSSSQPVRISLPFASSGAKQTIPNQSQIGIEDGRASFPDGFPPLTRTPLSAGGVPPFGTDMNGILYSVTNIQQWQSAGGLFSFDADMATAIGGYPKGCLLVSADANNYWQSTVDNNTSNPDTGGAGWVDPISSITRTLSGGVLAFAQGSAPVGWLKCNGSAISRTTYADLFAAIGTTYGAGNGTTTFNIPDLRAEFIRGLDDGRGIDPSRALGSVQAGTQIPVMTVARNTSTSGVLVTPTASSVTIDGTAVYPTGMENAQTAPTGAYLGVALTTQGTTSAVSFATRPRNVALLYCIKI